MSNTYGRIHGGAVLTGQSNTGYGVSYGQGAHGYSQSNNPQPSSNDMAHTVSPEDYLGKYSIDPLTFNVDKQNVNTYLREAVSSLLENRPANPILFMAEQ